ncbi:hypothetical protein HN011_001953 [Eciton burchellii]|nr:hypothetical protein HN011_001953 [Eciton burchellii]
MAGSRWVADDDDDLIFDVEGRQSALQVPLIETHQEESFFHRIKRGIWDFFSTSSSSTTTTQEPPGQEQDQDQEDIDNSVFLNGENRTLEHPEEPSAERTGVIERFTLKKDKDNEENDEHANEISHTAESQRIPVTYENDDEDLAGSGEIEGSANEMDIHPRLGSTENQHRTDGKARFYRVTLTVGEPYRREYSDRNSPEYRELSGNLTQAVEDLLSRHIPGYNYFANVVKISPTSDAFTSQVTLDIGSTFTDELEVRATLMQQLQYHALGNIQVGPEGFTFRIFQAGERDTQPECDQATELRCRSGACVPLESRCDGVLQCNDGSDEDNCPTIGDGCSAGEFACDVNRCILESQRCNFVEDCQDGSDEHDCNYPACASNEFICRNGQCIDNNKYCNGVQDCHDGSDEHNCPCREDQFECVPGYCLSLSRRCDGIMDCVNGMDEQNCRNMTRCRADEFECASGSCVSKNARCDGRNDCLDHSDEYNCNVTTCSGDQYRCLDGICLSIDKRCNGVADCRNGEDENQCGCGEAEFRCTDGRCIGYELQCNGVNECSDGSDERDCGLAPCPSMDFTCGDGSCIPKSSVCDGFDDCPRAEDELSCGT